MLALVPLLFTDAARPQVLHSMQGSSAAAGERRVLLPPDGRSLRADVLTAAVDDEQQRSLGVLLLDGASAR